MKNDAGELARETTPASEVDWGSFFGRYRVLAVRVAEGILGHAEQAEDLVQEAFRSVYERASAARVSFASDAHARNYLLRAVHNLAVDELRAPARRGTRFGNEVELESTPAPESQLELEEREERDERLASIERALGTLGPAEAEALKLRYAEGLTYREILERTGESISTLQSRVESALEKMRRKIGKGASPP